MRVLITGSSGFAGGWLTRACREAGEEVIGVARSGGDCQVDLTDAAAVRALVDEVQPEVVYHLAALSHVGRSWEDPASTLAGNVGGAVNLLEAIRHLAPGARVVWASSCEIYGRVDRLPVEEDAPLRPVNPYAVSKASGDMLAAVYAEAHGLQIVRARAFNHAGPGQLPIFIVSSLAEQAARGRLAGADPIRLITGNPDTRRDFTDVRDIVAAYRALADPSVPPGAYNIASGRSVSAADHVALITELLAPTAVEHVVDTSRVRAHEVMDHRGSIARLTAATGWAPRIAWWERELAAAVA
jgi:GDP-4-dehydro-6-deoxy-D-mannose reductase